MVESIGFSEHNIKILLRFLIGCDMKMSLMKPVNELRIPDDQEIRIPGCQDVLKTIR